MSMFPLYLAIDGLGADSQHPYELFLMDIHCSLIYDEKKFSSFYLGGFLCIYAQI